MPGQPDRAHRLGGARRLISVTERELRKGSRLDDDDRLIELRLGKIERWWSEGTEFPLPPLYKGLNIAQLRGLCSCSYSYRRLFFGSSPAAARADLAAVQHIDSASGLLRVVYSAPQLLTLFCRPSERVDSQSLSRFAGRIRAQRERRVAELSAEHRRQVGDRLAELESTGALRAALIAPGCGPSTIVGRWLRAGLLRQYELRDQLALRLNGGVQVGWNDDEPAVVENVCKIAARRYFGDRHSGSVVIGFVKEIAPAFDEMPVDRPSMVAVIREALGVHGAISRSVRPDQKYWVHNIVAAALTVKLGLDADAIDQLIIQGEQMALLHGQNPPLA